VLAGLGGMGDAERDVNASGTVCMIDTEKTLQHPKTGVRLMINFTHWLKGVADLH
jgi:hypothetical protein